jgi:hypothetical protein
LDEKLGLVEGQEPGRWREQLAVLAVLTPYPQAPQVCQTLRGRARQALTRRRVAVREADHLAARGQHHTLPARECERLSLEGDGQLCPTREPKQGPEEQGERAAKAGRAFAGQEVAEGNKERHEILPKIGQAKITDRETVRAIFAEVYRQAGGDRAAEVSVLAAGARGIWGLGEDLLPQAGQVLDCSHAQPYRWDAGKLIEGDGSAFGAPWVKAQERLLLEDKVEPGRTRLERFLDLAPALAARMHYFQQNASRMRYGPYRQRGYCSGCGAIERAGKQLSAARIKGPGRRWTIAELNLLLMLRCLFLQQSWQA